MGSKQVFKLAVQEYLETHSLEDLEREYGVSARLSTNGTKLSLNYDQTASKPGTIVNQCRGLIIRPLTPRVLSDDPNYASQIFGKSKVVAYPFNRFYNYGDPTVPVAVDLKDVDLRIEEKVDGTLIIVYLDDVTKEWCVATRSVADADVPISSGSVTHGELTFRKLFERAVKATTGVSFKQLTDMLSPDYTWMFEVVSTVNKVVVEYQEGIILLGCRSIWTGRESEDPTQHFGISVPSIADIIPRPKTHSLATIDDIIKFVNNRPPKEAEGVVLRDSNFNRVKIKNPDYVLASKSRDMLLSSRRNMIFYILAEKIDDMLPHLDKETLAEVERTRVKLMTHFDNMDRVYDSAKSNAGSDRKAFASEVVVLKYDTKYFFDRFIGKTKNCRTFYVEQAKSEKISTKTLDYLDDQVRVLP